MNTRSHSSGGASHIAPGDRLITPAFRQISRGVRDELRQSLHVVGDGDIGLDRPYPEFSRDASEALDVDIGNHDPGAAGDELLRERVADSAGSARDDGMSVVKPTVHEEVFAVCH